MSDGSFDPTRCPLCGESNECGMAAGRDECWCNNVTISKAALERLPEAARGVVCVCVRCGAVVTDETRATPPPTEPQRRT